MQVIKGERLLTAGQLEVQEGQEWPEQKDIWNTTIVTLLQWGKQKLSNKAVIKT